MFDDLYLGYYCHLIADELWIQKIYLKCMRDENRKKRIEQQNNYYHDYSKLNQIIRDKYDLKMKVEFLEVEIEEIDYKGVSELRTLLEFEFNTSMNEKFKDRITTNLRPSGSIFKQRGVLYEQKKLYIR